MSTITVTQKSKPLSIFDNRTLSLIVLAALVTVLVTIMTISAASPALETFDYNAYMLHRRGEWVSAPVSSAEAYQIFRQGEVASPVSNAEAYHLYRQGEWASVEVAAVDLSAYHSSERALIDPNAGLAIYLQSERTLVDAQAGLAAYFESERTSIPVSFTQHQLSEWFGK
jgi:hypothetical protein